MGKSSSKSAVTHNADPQIRIINNQELHSEILDHHEMLIIVVLIVVIIQLALTLYTLLQRRERKKALKFAKSVNDLTQV